MKKTFEKIVQDYIDAFINKQGLKGEADFYWVANRVGEIIELNGFFFNFSDIRFDVDNNLPKGSIFEWYDETMEAERKINFENWSKLKS